MDVETLLQSHGEDVPSGEDLEYDPAFMELEIAAQPGEERQAGDEIIAAEDPDYKDVAEKAAAIMERSHDLRAGVFMAEAQLRLTGYVGFAKAIAYIAGCLDQYWDTCHPQLDADDDDDPTMRVNAVLSLTDDGRILRGVRRAPLTKSRTFGGISLRDIAVAEGESTPAADMENIPDSGQVAAAFQDTDEDDLREIAEATAQAYADVQAIDALFDDKTPGRGPDLDPLLKLLKQANARLQSAGAGAADGDAADGDDAAATDGAPMGGGAIAGGGGAVGGINSPNDVQNALDRIIGYYERHEPSSPLPILLMRAKKLVNADFLTIVKNMAPEGVDNVNLIGGIEEDDDDD
ncbi:type VI secretion system protein TssA [uncultured Tateyamaria sp.]|uniref:type VI secretion system protein TssA n=1 Tax=uncultured Tateyamaria sp. TaxID=455651 RepID=UPI0026309B61|nr:type VI secretion system protein TssA [uncultured Tateyamaria sp.]